MSCKRRIALRVSVTDRCQLRCFYCMPASGVALSAHADILSFEEITRFVHVLKSGFELTKVHITGGEPLVRRDIVKLIGMLAQERIPDLALTTNGQALDGMACELKRAGLHRVNVSLDSLNHKTYAAITCGGDLDQTLRGIESALRAGLSVKLNTVVLRNYNAAETPALMSFAIEHNCQIRFLELMPIGCATEFFDAEFVAAAEIRKILTERLPPFENQPDVVTETTKQALSVGSVISRGVNHADSQRTTPQWFTLTPVSKRSQDSHKDFMIEDHEGRRGIVGFISPESEPFCGGCTRLRLTSTGELIPCLAHGDGTNIRHLLQQTKSGVDKILLELVSEMLANKGERDSFRTTRAMACVGG